MVAAAVDPMNDDSTLCLMIILPSASRRTVSDDLGYHPV